MLRPAQRRLVFLTTAFALSLLSCGREVTGPDNGINFGWRVASIALAPEMPTLMQVVEGAGDAVPFTRVRVVLRNEDGSVAKDTLVDFPSDADSVSLALALAIPSSAPATGLPLSLTMAYVNAAGDTVFRAGPSAILARPAGSPGADDPIVIPVTYDGPGKDAVAVVIAPDTGTRVAGTSQAFTAKALDAQSQTIANTPFVFFTLDSTRVQVGGATGVATWLPVRGTARIVAALPNGLRADTATFTVALPASQLVLASGGTQTGAVGAALTDSVVVRTLASDGEPAPGVVVTFAVASGGGTLSAVVDTTDADGKASTRWTLGTTLGAQAITAAAEGLSGSPLAIAATGVAGTPSQLQIASQPSTSIAGVTMAPSIVVEVRDAFGNVATTFTGDVSVAVAGTQPPTLGGTLTRSAVGGIATFNDLSINVVGAYQLAFTSPDLTPDTTTAISITPAAAASLEFVTQPAGGTAGAAIAPPVTVRALDAFGNVATGFTDSVSLALLNSGSAVLSGSAQENAVSGVATFSTLAVNLVGSTYNLAASSTALTPDTSAAFSITAAAPSALVVTAQPAEPRVSGAPFTVGVSAVDAFGNVSNSSTALATISIASGPTGAALSGVTSRALVAGAASFTDLALILAGSYQLAIAAPGLTGVTTGSISVTAGAAAAVTIIAGDAQSGVVNDTLANPLTVEVRDAAGNLVQGASVLWAVASGTANLTVGTVLTDTSGRAATRLVLGTTVGAASVTATVGTLPAVTFTATSVAGAASSLSIVSGADQQDFATQTLTSPVVLRVRDAFSNVRVGDSVFVSVTVGGGTLGDGVAEDTLFSDTQGAVSVTWTLGATAGTQSIQARTGTLAPVTISALALQSVANAIWTGDVSTSVSEPGNWRNAIVPSATDSVLIPAGRPNYPVLATSVTYSGFTLEDAATFDLANSNLTVTGPIRAPLGSGIIAIEGLVIGQAGVVAGVVAGTFPNLTIEGNYQPLGLVDVVGTLTIGNGANFTMQTGDSLHVGGNLITENSGSFTQSGNSGLSVTGNMQLDGGWSTFGAGGRLHLLGNLSTGADGHPRAFLADSAHRVILGPNATQSISFAYADSTPSGPCDASCLGILQASKGPGEGGVIFASTVMAQGGFQIEVESITATGQYVISGAPATIRGTSGGVFRRFGFTGSYDANAFSTDTLVAFGSSVLPISLTFPTIVAGQYSIVDIHGSSLVVTGSLDVNGASAQVAGSLITRGGGRLTMTDATDSLVVGGDLRFGGSGSAGQLTAGVLHAMADVFIDIASAVRADSAHVLWMSGATTTLTVADSASNRLGSLRLSGSTIAGFSGVAAKFAGDVVLSDAASFVVSGTQEMEIAGRLVDPAGSSFLATTILTGTNAIATPEFGADRLILRGSNALSANFAVIGGLWIESGGNLAPNTWSVDITDSLITSGTGIITMNSPEDTITVLGNAVFAGASTAGTLTAGTLTVHRSFTQLATNSPASFAPSGSHRTVLGDSTGIASESPFTLGFASTESSWFNQLYVPGGFYDITSAARSRGRADVFVSLQGRRFVADSGFYAASGNVALEHLSVAGVLEVPFGFTADTVEFRGPVGGEPSQVMPASDGGESSLPYQYVIVTGANVGMTDLTGFPYQISDLLHVASGSLLLGASAEVFADTATLAVTGSASLLWDASPPLAVRFDSVRIATGTPVAPSSGSLEFRSFSQVGLGNFQPSGSFLATKNLNGVIDFDDESGGAYFHNLRFNQNAIATLTSSVIVNGTLSRVNNTGTIDIQSNQLDLNSRVLTVNGGLGFPAGGEQSTRFRNVRLHLTGDYSAPTSLEFNNIRFERMDPNPTPAFLLSEHTGTAAVTWQNIVFDSPLESGLFFQWDAVGSGSITFQNASPALDCLIGTCTPGDVAPTGVAGEALEWVGSVSSQWTNAANWSPAIVPTFTSSVTIPDATTTLNDPLLDANTDIGSLTVQANGVLNIDVSDTLNVFGNMTVDGVVNAGDLFSAIRLRTTASGARSISATGGIGTRLVVAGDAVLVGRTNLSATAFQSGLFLQAGRLDLNGNTLDIAGSFRSHGNATLRMNDPLDTLIVDQNFEIGGGSTLGLLTDGEIIVSGVYFRQESSNSSTSFAATGNHSVRLAGGDLGMDVRFDTPDSTLSRFANLAFDRTGTQYLYLGFSPVFATNLTRVDGYIETLDNGDLIITGSVYNVDPGHLFSVYSGTFVDLLGVDPQTCDGLTFNVEFSIANFRPISCHTQLYEFAAEAGTANVRTNGMFALSDTQIWAVGENGSIQFGNNVSWTTQTSPTANELYAVHGTSSTNIWAVGAGGTILRFDGSAWTSTASSTEQTLRGVFAVSATSAFAVGDGGTILEYNGSAWTAVTSPTAQDLYSVYQASGSDMIASGAGGTALRLNLGAWGLTVTNTTALLAATWTTPGEYYLVGANGSILTRYNFFGPAWFEVESPTVNPLNALSGNSLAAFAVGNNGTILQKLGESFAQVNSPTISNLRGTAVTPNGTAYVAGDNGVILKALAPLP